MKIKGVLIDLSGTLHVDNTIISGAVESIQKLKATGLNVRFATNTTKESQRLLHERLIKLGFPIDINEIFTSLLAARDVVMREKLNPYLMIDPKALEDFAACNYVNQSNIHQADSVVIGLYPDIFNYHSMNQAFHILLKKLPLIAVHKARYYKCKDGQLSLGPGPFVTALEYATDSKAIVVGKPAKQFFLQAINDFGIKPEECAMIGDDVRDDVGGAISAGLIGMLVKTGKYKEGDENKINPPPHHLFPSIVEAIDYIHENNS